MAGGFFRFFGGGFWGGTLIFGVKMRVVMLKCNGWAKWVRQKRAKNIENCRKIWKNV
jgi:hypothetical protein